MSQISKRERRASFKSDFYDTYVKLIDFIEQINQKIVGRIQLVQQIYIEDYKAQVKEMAGQLRGIRIMLDEQLLRQRSNERMFFLEQERDFFREQVMKLNEELNIHTKHEQTLKAQLEQKTAESDNYRSLVYNLQRKLTRIQNQAIEMQKLRSTPPPFSTPSLSLPNKDLQSQSPTRAPSTTRLSPVPTHPIRQPFKSFKSVQLLKKQSSIDSELLRRQQILQRCIKDIKKKIFYRTMGEKTGSKVYFDEHKEIPFDKFTRSDKEQLISNLLNSGQLLEQFYSFMTAKPDSKPLIKQPVSKVAFSDKIFKIKLGVLTK